MASDSLNQVGKHLKNIKDTANYASKKVFLNKRIERSRDVFDTTVPFEMEFHTDHPTDQISLDLKFQKPPPRKGCNAECFSNNCETFTFSDGADHFITLAASYISGSVRVFRNRTLLTLANYDETDPTSGVVFVQGISASDEITICYVTGDCIVPPFDASQDLHFYFGTFTYLSDSAPGSSSGEGSTVYTDCNKPSIYVTQGSNWTFAVGAIMPTVDYAISINFGPFGQNGIGFISSDTIIGLAGSFTIPSTLSAPGSWMVWSTAAAGFHTPHTVNITFWIDPEGWIVPTPSSGQTVINDTPIVTSITGGQQFAHVTYPYVAGTLHVFVNNVEVVITETNPDAGEFIFAVWPVVGDTIEATYVAQ